MVFPLQAITMETRKYLATRVWQVQLCSMVRIL